MIMTKQYLKDMRMEIALAIIGFIFIGIIAYIDAL